VAGWVIHAVVEGAALFTSLLRELATVLGALHAEGNRFGGLACGIGRARDKLAEAARLDHHRRAAFLAFFIGGDFLLRHDLEGPIRQLFKVLRVLARRVVLIARAGQKFAVPSPFNFHHPSALFARNIRRGLNDIFRPWNVLCLGHILAEWPIEIADGRDPGVLAFFYFIEFFFHLVGEIYVHDIWEAFDQVVVDGPSGFGRHEPPFLLFNVPALLNRRGDGGIG